MMVRGKILNVAIAQNDGNCIYLMKKMISEIHPENRIIPLDFGSELSDYLNKKGKFLTEPLPDIFFIYVATAHTDYSGILKELRCNSLFREVPTYILYGSLLKTEIKKTLNYLISGHTNSLL